MKQNNVRELQDVNSHKRDLNSEPSTRDIKQQNLKHGYELLNADELYHMLNKKANGQIKVQSWQNYIIRDYTDILNFMENYSSFFENMDCLELGCNDGQFAFNFLYQFNPKKIRAIDFNYQLLEKAVDLKEGIRNSNQFQKQKKQNELLKFLESCPQNLLSKKFGASIQQLHQKRVSEQIIRRLENLKKAHTIIKEELQDKIIFEMENPFKLQKRQQYDVIICLHYLKHFHLSFGDRILEPFFQMIKSLLNKKGILLIDLGSFKEYYQVEKKNIEIKTYIQLKQDKLSSWIQKKFGLILLDQILIQSYRKKRLHLFLSYQIDFQVINSNKVYIFVEILIIFDCSDLNKLFLYHCQNRNRTMRLDVYVGFQNYLKKLFIQEK